MRRHAKASSAGSKLRKPSGHGASPPSGRLRLTILLATVAAFLLVPVAQAAAAGILKVNITGTGSGEVESNTPYGYHGEPPIECSYVSPGPATGVCENEMDQGVVAFVSKPSAGSEVASVVINKGFDAIGGGFCNNAEEQETWPKEQLGGWLCFVGEESGEAEVTVTFSTVVPKFPLTVTKEGTGSGTVVSSPRGIVCGSECSAEFKEGSKVTLTASPAAGSTFVSWNGCETGGAIGHTCKVTMSAAKTVKAKFTKTYDLTVKKTAGSTGLGKVQSSPSGVLCDASCSASTAAFKEGTSVTLTPTASAGSTFSEWSGACLGAGACVVTSTSEAKTVEAKFTAIPKDTLTVNKAGGGTGTVKSKPASIACGPTCSSAASAFYEGTEVELTATPSKGSTFFEWSVQAGTCTGPTNPCKVQMNVAKTVTARFE